MAGATDSNSTRERHLHMKPAYFSRQQKFGAKLQTLEMNLKWCTHQLSNVLTQLDVNPAILETQSLQSVGAANMSFMQSCFSLSTPFRQAIQRVLVVCHKFAMRTEDSHLREYQITNLTWDTSRELSGSTITRLQGKRSLGHVLFSRLFSQGSFLSSTLSWL